MILILHFPSFMLYSILYSACGKQSFYNTSDICSLPGVERGLLDGAVPKTGRYLKSKRSLSFPMYWVRDHAFHIWTPCGMTENIHHAEVQQCELSGQTTWMRIPQDVDRQESAPSFSCASAQERRRADSFLFVGQLVRLQSPKACPEKAQASSQPSRLFARRCGSEGVQKPSD